MADVHGEPKERCGGGQRKHYKDTLKANSILIHTTVANSTVADRSERRDQVANGAADYDEQSVQCADCDGRTVRAAVQRSHNHHHQSMEPAEGRIELAAHSVLSAAM